jgi:hypothetical protein
LIDAVTSIKKRVAGPRLGERDHAQCEHCGTGAGHERRAPGAEHNERDTAERQQQQTGRNENAIDAESRNQHETREEASRDAAECRPEENLTRDPPHAARRHRRALQFHRVWRQHAQQERGQQEQERRRDEWSCLQRKRGAEARQQPRAGCLKREQHDAADQDEPEEPKQ